MMQVKKINNLKYHTENLHLLHDVMMPNAITMKKQEQYWRFNWDARYLKVIIMSNNIGIYGW